VPDLGYSPLLSAILRARGIATREEAETFLSPAGARLADPDLLPDMQRAVTLIRQSIDAGRRITVFGDYDVDGLVSTALLVRALRRLGGDPSTMIPHRVLDGYGLTETTIHRLLDSGVELVILVDCGSSSATEISRLRAQGVEVIVVDHHHYAGALDSAAAYVSPRRPDNRYPCESLAAVGVVYALVRSLLGDEASEMYLPYVALGTVADIVELRGENRTLVARGIAMLRRWKLPGVMALCAAAGIDQRAIGTWEIGYVIGPRLNAAGRMGSPQPALDLLLADDAATATPLALVLSDTNVARQAETKRIQRDIEQQLAARDDIDDLPAIVVAGDGWGVGVAGLVASRIADAYARPTIVIERGPEFSRGSARSVAGVNIVEAIGACAALLERYGGHSGAAGLSIVTDRIAAFERQLCATIFDMCDGQLPERRVTIDAVASHRFLTLATVDELSRLEPFGRGNEAPALLVARVGHRYAKTSRDGRHLLLRVVDGSGRGHPAVMFGAGQRLEELRTAPRIDVVTNLVRDTWDGRERLKLKLIDFRASSAP
jgi:single-stranded-DNA-specific exonuclease